MKYYHRSLRNTYMKMVRVHIEKKAFISRGVWWSNNFGLFLIAYKNLDHGPWMIWLLIGWWFRPSPYSQFFPNNGGMNLSIWTCTKSSTNQRPDYRWSKFLETEIIASSKTKRNKCFLSIWTRTIFEFNYASACTFQTNLFVNRFCKTGGSRATPRTS